MTILFQRRQTTYPRSHTTEWDKTRARKRLAWCPLGHPCSCQSPSELCFTKDFTLKEARSYSDPLIPPPSTSSTQCRQGSTVNLPSPQDYMGLHSWLTDCYPRRESRKPRWQLSWPQVPSGGQAPQGLPSSLTPPPNSLLGSSLIPCSSLHPCVPVHAFLSAGFTSLRVSGIPCRPFEEGP